MANPKQLLSKIASYLNQNNRRFEETDGFTLKLSEQERINIETIQGMVGYYLVSFSQNQPSNEKIIEFLAN